MRFLTKVSLAVIASNFLPPEEAPAQIIPAGHTFTCTPVAVYDGDGPVWCAEGPKVRIAGVAAREMDGTCRHNQPCPPVGAIDARDRLVRLFGGPKGTLPEGHIRGALRVNDLLVRRLGRRIPNGRLVHVSRFR